ncbi:MAG: hypothetical protein VYD66_05745 [Candidatus Neomarinimicrobiota bacterium]|nr:hypothetical protein [Candidatus Neomarinimicrobiota bacterium]
MRNRPLFFISLFFLMSIFEVSGQEHAKNVQEFSPLKKRVYSFTKLDFITSEGEFNESICTLLIPDLLEDSPPYVAIYYKRDNSEWFTESLYRKRLRFNFKDGVLKLDQSNFWDWFEIAEIKIVVIY